MVLLFPLIYKIKMEIETITKETETIKLIKNTKGYNYEIKIIGTDIERLEKLNEEMIKRFKEDYG